MKLRLTSLLLLICASHYPLSPESGRLNVTLQSSNDQCVLLQGVKQLESGYSVDTFDLIDGGFDTFEIDPKNVGSRQFAFDPIGFEPYGPVEPSLFSNPSSAVLRAISEFPSDSQFQHISMSTCFLVGPDVAVMSGHAALSDFGSGTVCAEKITVSQIGIMQESSRLKADAVRVYTSSDFGPGLPKSDWALIKLDEPIGLSLGWIGLSMVEALPGEALTRYSISEATNSVYNADFTVAGTDMGGNFSGVGATRGGDSGSPYLVNRAGVVSAVGIHCYRSEDGMVGVTAVGECLYELSQSFSVGRNWLIEPCDFGYEDAYPTDAKTNDEFVLSKNKDGVNFRTRRYRVGYIQKEAIVLSPIRDGLDEMMAFLEFSFPKG
ncbi:MAG TPA: hypothetical protein IAC52_00705, partial [Candidatus Enteromonas pullicola]|nr:hypothetical protein [Candidatus Enteromonas pullicola]